MATEKNDLEKDKLRKRARREREEKEKQKRNTKKNDRPKTEAGEKRKANEYIEKASEKRDMLRLKLSEYNEKNKEIKEQIKEQEDEIFKAMTFLKKRKVKTKDGITFRIYESTRRPAIKKEQIAFVLMKFFKVDKTTCRQVIEKILELNPGVTEEKLKAIQPIDKAGIAVERGIKLMANELNITVKANEINDERRQHIEVEDNEENHLDHRKVKSDND